MQHAVRDRASSGRTSEILVVDDEREVAELAGTFLERADASFATSVVTDPNRAVERARRGRVDCLVTELRTADRSGLELCEEVRRVDPSVACMLYTNDERSTVVRRASEAGVGYVRKGVGTEQYDRLADAVRRGLAAGVGVTYRR